MKEVKTMYDYEIDIGQKVIENKNCKVFAKWIGTEAPIKYQLSVGVLPKNIFCPYGSILMKKLSDNPPACVTPLTAQKLVERGWGMMIEFYKK